MQTHSHERAHPHVRVYMYNNHLLVFLSILHFGLINKFFCAITEGNLQALQFAHEHGYAWRGFACAAAAKGGHFHVLKWLREKGCALDHNMCANAAGTVSVGGW